MVGNALLRLLLQSNRYEAVHYYGRRRIEDDHPRLHQHLGDLLEEDALQNIEADDIFCCIGTTQGKTPDLSTYKNIDYGIPLRAARAGLKGGMQQFLVLSSMGASSNSRSFYLKVKGQMEEALQKMAIPRLYILRPALLLGKREEFRLGERLAALVLKNLSWLLPRRYRAIAAETVARAMYQLAQQQYEPGILSSDEIARLGKAS